MRVRLDGRNCGTRIQRPATTDLRHEGGGTSEARPTLLLVEPTTGMRHQIRAHLAWIGLPILDDADYGSARPSEPRRLHLRAAPLDLSTAVPGEAPVVCPSPADFWPPAEGGDPRARAPST